MSRRIVLSHPPVIAAAASAVGGKEAEGPLGGCFDYHDPTDRFGKDTFEKAESELQHITMNLLLQKAHIREGDIDLLLAGDLLNQCTASAYGLLPFNRPYLGLYGACSTSAEGLALASLLLSGGAANTAAVVVSSHYASAERQFRYPLEYGGQRTPTAQWTVTGSGAFYLRREGSAAMPAITEVAIGKIVTGGIRDLCNMGAAMAPAAFDTLQSYFRESGGSPADFDGIFTGDLGFEGHAILSELLESAGYPAPNLGDCGLLVYDRERQDMHAGGSGCGCSASVLAGYLLPKLQSGALRRILFLATGALMSPGSVWQGGSIPGIAHLLRIESRAKEA